MGREAGASLAGSLTSGVLARSRLNGGVADFSQTGRIATLHNLGGRPIDDLEGDLLRWSHDRPMALVIPCLFSELGGPALDDIVDQIAKIPYLTEVIVGIDRADEAQFSKARSFFSRLPQRHRLLWNDGPRLRAIDQELSEHGLAPEQPGKGRNVWYCLGYFIASGRSTAVALHDADVLTYDRSMVAKLLYPIVHPTFDYHFAKGYYYRATEERLGGRVVRLFVAPMLRALRETVGSFDYLDFLDSFRYPLAGEFSMRADVVHTLRMPSDWGLEIGILSEIYRNHNTHQICQVDIADRYDHKHQDLSPDDPNAGLHKMTIDIAIAIYRKLAISGAVFSPETFRSIKASYYRQALDLVDHYHNDAVMNGYALDRHGEESTVELFSQSVMEAGTHFLDNPMDTPFIPSWSRVESAVPDLVARLEDAVEADNA